MSVTSLNIKGVFDQYFKALVLFSDRYIGCREESESIVQDTFVYLWERKLEFENSVALKSWLYTTVRNKALNVIKHQKILSEYHSDIREKTSEVYYMRSLMEEETRRLLLEAVHQLPEQCRRVCLLALDGYDNQRMAEIMEVSVDTVKFHKKNAYKLLREKLKHMDWRTVYMLLSPLI